MIAPWLALARRLILGQQFPSERLNFQSNKPLFSLLGVAFFSIALSALYLFLLLLYLTTNVGFSISLAAIACSLLFLIVGIASPVVGIILDRVRYKPLLFAGCIFEVLGIFLIIQETHGHVLAVFLGVFILGIGRSLFRVSLRTGISRILPKNDLPIAFGSLHAAHNAGIAIAPAIAGILLIQNYPIRDIFMIALAGYAALGALILLILPPGLSNPQKNSSLSKTPASFPIAWPLVISYLTLSLIEWMYVPQPSLSLAVYLSRIHIQPALAGFFFSAQGLLVVIFVPLAGRCMRGWKTPQLFQTYILATCLLPIGFLAFYFSSFIDVNLSLVSLCFFMLFDEMLAVPSGGPLSALIVPKENHGFLFGLSSSVSSLGDAIGTVMGGFFLQRAEKSGFMPDYWKNIGIVFLCAWALAAMFALFSLRRYPWPAEAIPHA